MMFDKNNDQPQVKCSVENCAYNEAKCCHASCIKVDCCCDGDQAKDREGTECASFKNDCSCGM